jgi:uncharacterized membrane protein
VSDVPGDQTPKRASHGSSRLTALDAMRGLIMVLMALDHANHFIAQKHPPGEYWGGAFPVYYNPLSFVTRLTTHPAAPGFSFLVGASVVLFAASRRNRGWSQWAIVRHFLIRGGLLVALQFLLVNRAWELSPTGWGVEIYVGVLVALGAGMVLGSLLLRLQPRYLLALTAMLVVGAELLTPNPDQWGEPFAATIHVLLVPGGRPPFWVNYPILQWLELVTLGMAFGHWLTDDPRKAFGRALRLGAGMLLGFVVIRYLDGFGNIRPRMGNTWIDFLNPVKYPPSIAFNLLTMGVNLTTMGLFGLAGAQAQRLLQALTIFGRTPLLFYVLHLFLYLGIGLLLTPGGTSTIVMCPLWLLGLLILYPVCLWYGRLKHRQQANPVLHFL